MQFNFNRYMERRHIEGPNGSVQCTGVTATRALYEATVRREVCGAASYFCFHHVLPRPWCLPFPSATAACVFLCPQAAQL